MKRPKWRDGETGWKVEALCSGADPDLWYPGKGESIKQAVAVCQACPVQIECLEAGLDEEFGIWGGLSFIARREIKRARRRSA